MVKLYNNYGFSLTEVLLAVGTLAVGMIFIAGIFPVGIYFTTIATERTIAAVVADEAFAKVRLHDVDLTDPNLAINSSTPVREVALRNIAPSEFAYPSTSTNPAGKQYYWSALCRLTEQYNGPDDPNRLVQVTVFVCRKIGAGGSYWARDLLDQLIDIAVYPVPVRVKVLATGNLYELLIDDLVPVERTFINDGYTIVDDRTGQLYRILERYAPPDDKTILLDRPWEGGPPGWVWVVPPPVNGGRYPCIAIYQKVIRF